MVLTSRLGLAELASQLSDLAKIKWNLSEKGFEGNLTGEERAEFNKANDGYRKLEILLREKFREHGLSDDQTAGIMDHIWTNWLRNE